MRSRCCFISLLKFNSSEIQPASNAVAVCILNVKAVVGQARASSSDTRAYPTKSASYPPYSFGAQRPRKPSPASSVQFSYGKVASRSYCAEREEKLGAS